MKPLFIVLVMLSVSLYSQKEKIISGNVMDSITNEPIQYATIAVYKGGLLIDGASSDSKGHFFIKIKEDYTHIEISFIGYKKQTIGINEIADAKNRIVHLVLDDNQLDEVVVQGERMSSQLKIDRKIINLGSDIQQSGVNALEAFDQIPEVETNITTGTVSLRGNDNVQILVNGKLSPLNASELLQQIQSSNIDYIEIITSPSAKHLAQGLSGIINIVLKKQKNLGLNLVANASTGTRRHGFGFDGNYNFSWYNFKLGASHSKLKTTNNQFIRRIFGGNSTENIFTPYEFDGTINTITSGLDFFINSRHELSIGFDYTDDSHDFVNNSSFTNVTGRNDYELLRINPHKHYITVLNGNYRLSFDEKNHFLEFDYNLNSSDNTYPITDFEDGIELFDQILTEDFKLQSLAFDYTFPIYETGNIEMGLLRNTQFLESTRLTEVPSEPEQFNQFEYDEVLWSFYAQSSFTINKFAIQAGLRYERFTSDSESRTNAFMSSMKFNNLFPSIHLSYNFKDESVLNIGYSKRVSRPNFHHVNAFQIVSPLYIWEYNPNITPEFSDNIELSYQTKIRKLRLGLTAFYRKRIDVILWTQTGNNNQQVFRYENSGVFNSYGLESNFRYKMATFWDSLLTANYYFTKVEQSQLVTWDELYSSAIQFKNTFKLNKNISTDLTYLHRSKRQRTFNFIEPRNRLDWAIRFRLFENKLTASFRLVDIFDSYQLERTTITENLFQETTWDIQLQTRNFLFSVRYDFLRDKGKIRNRKQRKYNETPID